jgi:hypothetical protein
MYLYLSTKLENMNEKLKGHSESLTKGFRPGLDYTDAITKLAHCRGAFTEK